MLTVNQEAPNIRGLYINGEWVPASGSFDSFDPSSRSLYARIPDGSARDVAAAAEAARIVMHYDAARLRALIDNDGWA